MSVLTGQDVVVDALPYIDHGYDEPGVRLVMTRVAPDIDLAGYPANIFAGYPVSGRISRMADIRLNSNIEFIFLKKCTFI